jgi:hypothetical protein
MNSFGVNGMEVDDDVGGTAKGRAPPAEGGRAQEKVER